MRAQTTGQKNLVLKRALKPVEEKSLDQHSGGAGIWGCCMYRFPGQDPEVHLAEDNVCTADPC